MRSREDQRRSAYYVIEPETAVNRLFFGWLSFLKNVVILLVGGAITAILIPIIFACIKVIFS